MEEDFQIAMMNWKIYDRKTLLLDWADKYGKIIFKELRNTREELSKTIERLNLVTDLAT